MNDLILCHFSSSIRVNYWCGDREYNVCSEQSFIKLCVNHVSATSALMCPSRDIWLLRMQTNSKSTFKAKFSDSQHFRLNDTPACARRTTYSDRHIFYSFSKEPKISSSSRKSLSGQRWNIINPISNGKCRREY